jgi:diaminopimelate decarboxylase
MEIPEFFNAKLLTELEALSGTPCYVYDEATIRRQMETMKKFPAPFGLFPRYAMKACPTRAILKLIAGEGIGIDASSGFEIDRALRAGVDPTTISLSSQELPADFDRWIEKGVKMNACSISQLRRYGEKFPNTWIGVRFNPGLGSGGTAKTNVGGPSSSFGIWHEKKDEVKAIAEEFSLTVERIHTHIGSGSDPAVWQRTANLSLALVREFETVQSLNLGGGYKVARMANEISTDLLKIGEPVATALTAFAEETGRTIRLEIEPGTFVVANAGYLVSRVQDVVNTGTEGHRFLKLDSGMTELLRPSLYAAQHPITIIRRDPAIPDEEENYVIVGHCCESGDLVTPAPEDGETLSARTLPTTQIGDWCIIGGAGAYCSAMSTKNYNSFPEAPEVLLKENGDLNLIRRRQTLDQLLDNEI